MNVSQFGQTFRPQHQPSMSPSCSSHIHRSSGGQLSKRSIRGALEFSGLFPASNLSSKEADAAPKLLDESEADSILWGRPLNGKEYVNFRAAAMNPMKGPMTCGFTYGEISP